MPKYHVTGRVRADCPIDEIVEAKTQSIAIKIAEQNVYKRIGITVYEVLDDEVYCDVIREKKNKFQSLVDESNFDPKN